MPKTVLSSVFIGYLSNVLKANLKASSGLEYLILFNESMITPLFFGNEILIFLRNYYSYKKKKGKSSLNVNRNIITLVVTKSQLSKYGVTYN